MLNHNVHGYISAYVTIVTEIFTFLKLDQAIMPLAHLVGHMGRDSRDFDLPTLELPTAEITEIELV